MPRADARKGSETPMPSPSGCAMPTASAPPARLLLRSRRPAHDHAGLLHAPLACRHSLPRGLPACLPPPARAPWPGAAPSRPSMAARAGARATMRAGPKAGKRAGASASAGSAGRRRQEHRRVCRRRHSRQPRQPGAARRARKAPDAGQPCPPDVIDAAEAALEGRLARPPAPLREAGSPARRPPFTGLRLRPSRPADRPG